MKLFILLSFLSFASLSYAQERGACETAANRFLQRYAPNSGISLSSWKEKLSSSGAETRVVQEEAGTKTDVLQVKKSMFGQAVGLLGSGSWAELGKVTRLNGGDIQQIRLNLNEEQSKALLDVEGETQLTLDFEYKEGKCYASHIFYKGKKDTEVTYTYARDYCARHLEPELMVESIYRRGLTEPQLESKVANVYKSFSEFQNAQAPGKFFGANSKEANFDTVRASAIRCRKLHGYLKGYEIYEDLAPSSGRNARYNTEESKRREGKDPALMKVTEDGGEGWYIEPGGLRSQQQFKNSVGGGSGER